MTYYVVVHGGAGFHSTEDEKEVRKALSRACMKALRLLQNGKNSCEAVQSAIVELEDSEWFNAGYGANLTYEGSVECDAAIMKDSGEFGSVGAVSGVQNPICAAKAILDYSSRRDPLGRVPPLTLVSSGAHDFASASGLTTVRPDVMVSARAQHEWKVWSEKLKGDRTSDVKHPKLSGTTTVMQDTVGSVALDASGRLAAGVSSGGLLLKLPGRAAVFGAGCWAQHSNTTGVASSVSGTGEAIVRMSLARNLCEVFHLSDPHEELRDLFAEQIPRLEEPIPSAGGIVLVKELDGETPTVRLWCVFNTPSMAIAYASWDDPRPKSMILKRSESDAVAADDSNPIYLTVLPWTD